MTKPVDDLPDALKAQLSKKNTGHSGTRREQIRRLMNESPATMTIDDILVAVYRDSGEIISRRSVFNCLFVLKELKHITRVSSGLYGKRE